MFERDQLWLHMVVVFRAFTLLCFARLPCCVSRVYLCTTSLPCMCNYYVVLVKDGTRVACHVILAKMPRKAQTLIKMYLNLQIPDYNEPVVMPREKSGPATVEAFCNRIHKGLMKQFKWVLVVIYVYMWPRSCKHFKWVFVVSHAFWLSFMCTCDRVVVCI